VILHGTGEDKDIVAMEH